jgi:hypothetical protein
MDLEPESLLAALRRMHIGHVSIPTDRVKTRCITSDSTMAGPCLEATVPDWLIRSLDRAQDAPRARLAVSSVANEHELWATLVLKRADVELRILMPLDDAGVQAFFHHGLRGGDLCLVLETEDRELSAHVVVGVSLGDSLEFEELLRKARRLNGSLTRQVQVAQLMSCATPMPLIQVDSRAGEAG